MRHDNAGRALKALRALLLSASLFGSGCHTLTSINGPPPAFDIDQDIKELQQQYASATSIKDYYAQVPETTERRDAFIVGRLTLYNLQYIKFISQFDLEVAQLDSAFDITKLGVDLATTLVPGATTKAILGAVSGGLTGARISLEKNFFEQKTIQALVTEMNAQRKTALVPIVAGLKQNVADYPLASAVVDLDRYYQAGTLTGALQGVQTDAAAQDAQAQSKIDQYRSGVFVADASTARLQQWLWPGVKTFNTALQALDATGAVIPPNHDHLAALQGWIAQNLAGLPVGTFLYDTDLAATRASAIKALNIP
jgi:hypothetical protein